MIKLRNIVSLGRDREILFAIDRSPKLAGRSYTELSGWVLGLKDTAELVFFVGEVELTGFVPFTPRLDVARQVTGARRHPICGFSFSLPESLLKAIGPDKLQLRARAGNSEKLLWSWEGGNEPDNPAFVEPLCSFLLRYQFSQLKRPAFHNKQITLHVILEVSDPEPGNISRLVSDLHQTGLFENAASLSLVCDTEEELEACSKEHLPKKVKLYSRKRFPAWRTFPKEQEHPLKGLVLSISDKADFRWLSIEDLVRDFLSTPGASVFMPACFGANAGLNAPQGIHLSSLRSFSKVAGGNAPALVETKSLSAVWLTSLALLEELEPPVASGCEGELSPIVRPPENSFPFYIDLRQGITLERTDRCYHEDHRICYQAAFLREVEFRSPIKAGCTKRAVFVVSEEETRSPLFKFIAKNIARGFEDSEIELSLVFDGDSDCDYLEGLVLEPFHPFCERLKAETRSLETLVFCAGWRAMLASQTISYLTSGDVVWLDDDLDRDRISKDTPENLKLLDWTASSDCLFWPFDLRVKEQATAFGRRDFEIFPTPARECVDTDSSLFDLIKAAYVSHQQALSAERSSPQGVSLLIPVYCALDATVLALESVMRYAPDDWEIVIVNDASDRGTTEWLRSFVKLASGRVKLVDLQENRGFVMACSAGVEACNPEHDIILVNSDIILTKYTLLSLQRAALSRWNIGLASCLSTNSPHLQLNPNPGASLEEVAETLQQYTPQYPTIITPEGQLLYLRRWALKKLGFFDPVYSRGFCEESDLCMRMFLHGVDMVCADNAYIHHRRSASFGKETRLDLISENRPVFDARWGRYYGQVYREFLARKPIDFVRRWYREQESKVPEPSGPIKPDEITNDSFLPPPRGKVIPVIGDSEVVFILPSVVLGGGTLSVLQHVDELQMRGIKCKVISLSATEVQDRPFTAPALVIDAKALNDLDWKNQVVVSTFWTTSYVVRDLVATHPGLRPFYYVQDYEPWFYSRPAEFGAVEKASASYEFGFPMVAKTAFLTSTLRDKHQVDCELITPGIDDRVFYPGDAPQAIGRPRFVALYRTRTPRRGTAELLELIRIIRKRLPEARFSLFGKADDLPEEFSGQVEMLGTLPPARVAALYRCSVSVIDLSFWQGFGRMGLEGMSCGAVPVLSDSGGIHRYAEHGVNSFVVAQGDVEGAADCLVRLSLNHDLRLRMRASAIQSASQFNERAAVDDWVRIWGLTERIDLARDLVTKVGDVRALLAQDVKLQKVANL